MSLEEIKLGGNEFELTYEQQVDKAEKAYADFLRHYGGYVADQLMPYVNNRFSFLEDYEPENHEQKERKVKEVDKLLHVKNEVIDIYKHLKFARQKLDERDLEYFWAVFREARWKAAVLKIG